MTLIIRAEMPADVAAIRAVHFSAFPAAQEADLVDVLRADGDLVLSLVAVRDGAVTGHIAFSRMMARNDKASPAVALAPLAVRPEFQRMGIGSALVESGLQQLAKGGEMLVFVVGSPAYYGRFGFGAGPAAGFTSLYAGPYFQVKRLADHAPASGSVHYARAFSGLT